MAENEWTSELKEEVIAAYRGKNPTPENTMDIVKAVAEKFNKTPNGVRMVLTRADVYVKKTTTSTTKSTDKPTTTRVNKAEAISNLKKVIKSMDKEVDSDICDRLTGKAAVYIAGLLG